MIILFFQRHICNLILLFSRKVCILIPLFSQKHSKEDISAFFLLEKNEKMLLTYEKNERGMILFYSRGKFSYHRQTITNHGAEWLLL